MTVKSYFHILEEIYITFISFNNGKKKKDSSSNGKQFQFYFINNLERLDNSIKIPKKFR